MIFSVEFDNHLSPGKYYPTVNVARRGGGLDVIHRIRRMATITVFGSTAQGGVVDLPYVVTKVERAGEAAELSRELTQPGVAISLMPLTPRSSHE